MSSKPLDAVDLDFLKQEFARFREQLAGAKEQLGGNAHEVLDQINAYLNGDAISARISSLEDQLSSLSGKLKDKGADAVERLEVEVTSRPLASVALAFGVGLLAAQFFRRR